jgi:hypothetical protein
VDLNYVDLTLILTAFGPRDSLKKTNTGGLSKIYFNKAKMPPKYLSKLLCFRGFHKNVIFR